MRLILIRHCKTVFNVSGHIMGWADSPRVEDWQEDVVYIENILSRNGIMPDAVCSSALGRARDTADYFAEKLEQQPAFHEPQLNEINYGTLTEKSKKWVAENYPLHKKDPDFIYPEGESFRQMQQRSVDYIFRLATEQPSFTALCVAHAGVIRALVSHFLDLDFAQQLKRKVSHRYIGVLNFTDGHCTGYEELGEPSGFVVDEVIPTPHILAGNCTSQDRIEPLL